MIRVDQALQDFWRRDRSLSVVLAILVFIMFIASPLGAFLRFELITHLAFAVLLVSGLAVVSSHRRILVAAGILLLVDLAAGWSGRWLVIPSLGVFELVLNGLFVAAMIFVMLARSLRGGKVTAHCISGAVAAYLLCGLLFAHAFALVDSLSPGSFSAGGGSAATSGDWSGYLYFSMVTLATLGYGDIVPLHPVARSLATLEAFLGQLYPAILIGRLVALEIEHRHDRSS